MRLFFALWPEAPLRERLAALAGEAQAHYGGRRVEATSLHLTLAFLGEVPKARLDELIALTEGLACPSGDWTLDRLGHFRRAGVLWLGSEAPCPALTALHEALWRRLAALGFTTPPRPFLPHVTLLRKVRRLPTTNERTPCRLDWRYHQMRLIHSAADGYRCLARSGSA